MKLKRLTLTNFMGYRDATLDLSAQVTMVHGRNGTGKTAIANALEVVFTDKARGVKFKKDMKASLAGDPKKAASVTLVTDENEYIHALAASTGMSFPWPDALLGVLCDHMRLAHMSQAERQNLFRDVLGDKDDTIGDILEKIDPESLDMLMGSAAEELLYRPAIEIDEAERFAVENRRATKRAIAELEAADVTQASSSIDYQGEQIDVTGGNAAAIEAKLATVQAERDAIMRHQTDADPKQLAIDIAQAEQEILQLEEDWPLVAGECGKAKELVSSIGIGAQTRATVATERLRALTQQATRMSGIKGQCILASKDHPVACGMSQEVLENVLGDLEREIKSAKSEANKLADEATKATRATSEAQAHADTLAAKGNAMREQIKAKKLRITQLTAEIGKAADWTRISGQLDTLDARLAKGRALLAGVMAYSAAKHGAEAATLRLANLAAELHSWDMIAGMLGKSGPVREALAGDIGSSGLDEAQQTAWACKVECLADGSITWDGRAIELCSYSEQWRACMLVADLLAQVAKVGWIVLDQLDSLEAETRRPINAWLSRHADGHAYQTIILLAAAADKPDYSKLPPWLAAWWTDGQGFERIGGN